MKEKRSFISKLNELAIVGNNITKALTSTLCLIYVSTLIGITLADLKGNKKTKTAVK